MVQILNVYSVGRDTPLILLAYISATAHEPIEKTHEFIQEQMKTGSVGQITATRQEQALLRRLFYLNSTKIAPAYKPDLRPYEKGFRTCFLLPVGPLSQMDIGKLTNDPGCALCGEKTTSRCSSCLSMSYCGPGTSVHLL
jgi:hypothetical protein